MIDLDTRVTCKIKVAVAQTFIAEELVNGTMYTPYEEIDRMARDRIENDAIFHHRVNTFVDNIRQKIFHDIQQADLKNEVMTNAIKNHKDNFPDEPLQGELDLWKAIGE